MLTEIFGNCSKVKVIDLIISHPGTEYSKTDIAKLSGISRSTLYEFIEQLEEYGIIKATKKVGNIQLYELDTNSEITQLISAFQLSLADIEVDKQIELSKNGVKADYDDLSEEELDAILDASEPETYIDKKHLTSNMMDFILSYLIFDGNKSKINTFANKPNISMDISKTTSFEKSYVIP